MSMKLEIEKVTVVIGAEYNLDNYPNKGVFFVECVDPISKSVTPYHGMAIVGVDNVCWFGFLDDQVELLEKQEIKKTEVVSKPERVEVDPRSFVPNSVSEETLLNTIEILANAIKPH